MTTIAVLTTKARLKALLETQNIHVSIFEAVKNDPSYPLDVILEFDSPGVVLDYERFALPILQTLLETPTRFYALVLAPTRELCVCNVGIGTNLLQLRTRRSTRALKHRKVVGDTSVILRSASCCEKVDRAEMRSCLLR